MNTSQKVSRRQFVEVASGVTAGSLAAPYFVPADVLAGTNRVGANDRINIGWIGMGRRSHQMLNDLRGAKGIPGAKKIIALRPVF